MYFLENNIPNLVNEDLIVWKRLFDFSVERVKLNWLFMLIFFAELQSESSNSVAEVLRSLLLSGTCFYVSTNCGRFSCC